ncbi:MAG: hypothetical protein RIS64_3464 [Bacteroidota bacterium]
MRYISPIRHLAIDTNQVDATGNMPKSILSLAKKRLLAEIDLSPTQTVWVGSAEMTKNDVLKWFEALTQSGELRFHTLIARDSILLEFLEKQRLEAGAFFNWDLTEKEDDHFISFVSPYYKTSFKKVLVDALEKQQAPLIDTLLHYNPILMTGLDEDSTWLKIHHYVKDKLERFEGIVLEIKSKKNYTIDELKKYYDTDMLLSLNHLPDSFQKLRDDYGVALINLSGFSWNNGKYNFAQEVILIAQTLECSPRETHMIQERIKWYEANFPASARNDSGGCAFVGKDLMQIVFGFVLFFNLIRLISTCGRSNHSNPSLSQPIYKYQDMTTQKIHFLPKDQKRKEVLDSLKNHILSRPSGANTRALQDSLAQYVEELSVLETKKVNMQTLIQHQMQLERAVFKHHLDSVKVPKLPKSKFESLEKHF